MKNYGKELVLDLLNCDVSTFTRKSIGNYFKELCELIDMEREKLCWWDYHNDPEAYRKAPAHLKGISAVQFIKTSNITIHTLDTKKEILLNIFSCKDYETTVVVDFTKSHFRGKIRQWKVINRG